MPLNIRAPLGLSSDVISSLHLPKAVSFTLRALHFGNFLGRTIRHLQFQYESPIKYLAGAMLHKYADGELVKRIAQIIAVTEIFLRIINEGSSIKTGISNIKNVSKIEQGALACYLNERISHETWSAQEGKAPGYLFLSKRVAAVAHRVTLFGHHFFSTIGSLWRLNGLLFDLYDTAVLDPHEAGSVIQNVAINLSNIVKEGSGLGKRLAGVVKAQKEAIDSTLKVMKVGYDAERLENFLTTFSDSTIFSLTGKVADVAKKSIAGTVFIAGQMAGFNMPVVSLVPDPVPESI